jgi:hypothetical protein
VKKDAFANGAGTFARCRDVRKGKSSGTPGGVGQQLGVRVGDAFHAVRGGEGRGPVGVASRDRDQSGTGGVRRFDDGQFGDPGGAEHADT